MPVNYHAVITGHPDPKAMPERIKADTYIFDCCNSAQTRAYIISGGGIIMNSITKKRMGDNKWIVTHSDEVEFALHETLSHAKIYSGSCAGYGLHKDAGYGYTENDDGGRTTYFGRIVSITGSELDEMNRQDVESRIQGVQEHIDYLQEGSSFRSWDNRKDGYLIDENNDLCFKCEKGKIHRVYGVENEVVYH